MVSLCTEDTHYAYTKDLLALAAAQLCSPKTTLPEDLASIVTLGTKIRSMEEKLVQASR